MCTVWVGMRHPTLLSTSGGGVLCVTPHFHSWRCHCLLGDLCQIPLSRCLSFCICGMGVTLS